MQVSTQPLLDLEITLDSSPSCPSRAMCAWQQQCGACQEELTSTQSGTSAGKPWEHSQQLVLAGGPEHCTSFVRLGWNFHRASVHAIGYGRLYLLGGRLHWQGRYTKEWITETAADHCIVKALLLALQLLLLSAGSKCFRSQLSSPSLTLRYSTAHSNCIRSNTTKPILAASSNSQLVFISWTWCKARSTKNSL